MTTTACCDAGAPVQIHHRDKGREITIGADKLRCYVSGDLASCRAAVILFADIFGIDHPQLREVADRFAEARYYTIMPDCFRGDPWTHDLMPPRATPERQAKFDAFLNRINSVAASDFEVAMDHVRSGGLDGRVGVAGFCWGGIWAVKTAADDRVGAGVVAHPALITQEMVDSVQAPMRFYPAGGDVDCAPLCESLIKRGLTLSHHKRFEDQVHGFVAARGDWSNPSVAAAATEVIHSGIDLFSLTLL